MIFSSFFFPFFSFPGRYVQPSALRIAPQDAQGAGTDMRGMAAAHRGNRAGKPSQDRFPPEPRKQARRQQQCRRQIAHRRPQDEDGEL
ncbi:MAG: hypothetical protein IJW99_10250 [Clostridia bacterium]|nr:hypothetical protein [Clostridia bacterium]